MATTRNVEVGKVDSQAAGELAGNVSRKPFGDHSPELPDLEAKLRNQVRKWQSKLLDLGNRNALINCSFNPSRGVVELLVPQTENIWRELASEASADSTSMRFPWRRELVPPPRGADKVESNGTSVSEATKKEQKEWNPPLEECLVSRKLSDSDLLTPLGDKALDRRLRTLDGHARLSMSEQGVHCLYVAFGFLKWFESLDSDVEHFSPLMLVPAALSRASADAPWELTEAEDDVIDNLCLRERLKQDFGMLLPPLPEIDDLEEQGARHGFLEAVRKAIAANERWEVQERCALGRFAFPKIAMWQDLGDHAGSVLANPLCQSIGGDPSIPPEQSFGFKAPLPEAAKLDDEISPGDIKTILDCDSSQLESIIAARRGVSFVLDGPPGTGKSQTIANMIADALSEGRRVLFVSEKVSALEVVKRRLDDCGLGDFCLECHSSKANRKAVLDELKYCLDLPVEVYDDVSPKFQEAKLKRQQLNQYVRAIHRRRPPLGLSPYELYGHVSRSHRLGHAVKSRCTLPIVTSMDRARFEDWLQLIDRAQESTKVIHGFSQHPWRGCQLTSRTLTLADDLHHHLVRLAAAFDVVHRELTPLIQQELVPSEPTAMTLNAVLQNFQDALASPHVPEDWFQSPQAVATAVLNRCEAVLEGAGHRAQLAEFVHEVEADFPDNQLAGLTLPAKDAVWLERFAEPLPETVRRQQQFLGESLWPLRSLVQSTEVLIAAATATTELLPVPIRKDLPPYKLGAVVELARQVAKNVPLHPAWLQPENWPKLRAASQSALAHIDEASGIARRLDGRLPVAQIVELNRSAEHAMLIQSAREAVKLHSPDGTREELAALEIQLQDRLSTVKELQWSVERVLQWLGVDGCPNATWKLVRSLETALPMVVMMNELPGQWRDASVRAKLRSACDAAISDLEEAVELRQLLEVRLSHRAFKPAAVALADRASTFQSFWKRWFGGFPAYQVEVADLFKSGAPATRVLLTDLVRLRSWHRRMAAVEETTQELAGFLPASLPHDNLDAWKTLRSDLVTFDQLANLAPELVGLLPGQTIMVDRPRLAGELSQISSLIQEMMSQFAELGSEQQLEDGTSLNTLVQKLTSLKDAATRCQSAHTTAARHYTVPPRTLAAVIDDLQLAARFAALQDGILLQARNLMHMLPPEVSPTAPAMWLQVQRGVAVAERLSKLVPSLEPYQEALCQEDRLDPDAISTSGTTLEKTYQAFLAALRDVVPQLSLLAGQASLDELIRRQPGELLANAQAALAVFSERHRILTTLLPILLPGEDVEINVLPEVQMTVASIRKCRQREVESISKLQELNVDPNYQFDDGAEAVATWLLQQSNASPIPRLTREVVTSPEIREKITRVLSAVQQPLGGDFSASLKFLNTIFSFQSETSAGPPIPRMPLAQLVEFLQRLQAEVGSLDDWLKFSRWRRDMEEQGFGGVVEELLASHYPADEAKSVIAARFFRLVFDQFAGEDRLLGEFDLEEHEQSRERFRKLDEWEVRAASSRIRQYQLGRDDRPRSGWFAEVSSELGTLQREIQKKRRQLPLRRLFAEIPSVLQRLKPCIMMSPLSVSTFLQSDQLRFDLVIFDEASQVFPWDAIGAIYRGSQLIVAGDEKQLPPTNFFNRTDLESGEDEESEIGDFESILSLCKSIGMPGRRLRWHYRSRREPLIAFSNRHFYQGDLVTFPSIRDATSDAVRLEFVPQGRWIDRANLPEAERVTDLIIHHLRSRPETSLGVIAFNQSQQVAIDDAIYERRRKYPEVEALFHAGLSEPPFVKNLENVQGDERDVIILSMGYGYNETGKFLKNFGPLTKSGGERRLNVAVTRAREEVILVASVKSADLDLSGSTSLGAHLLKGYLEYAERGVDSLAREIDSITGESESTFEQEVATALIERGLHPVLQVGCGGFRIDLALKHPQRLGEFCLGIECDGATYHSSKTARDRDRIRQDVLESLGWILIRIWSTDWIRNPSRQLMRVLDAYGKASVQQPLQAGVVEPDTDEDLEDPSPRIEAPRVQVGPAFKNIREVSEYHLLDVFQSIVKRGGAIDLEGLVQQAARQLGFARTGTQIRKRLEAAINDELQVGHLRWVGDRIGPVPQE